MPTAVGCLVQSRDPRLVSHARPANGWVQVGWRAVAATAGSGVWATHLIAMLALEPGVPSGHDIALTGLSLVIAILLLAFCSHTLMGHPSSIQHFTRHTPGAVPVMTVGGTRA